MKLNQSLKRLEVYTKKLVQGQSEKAKREREKEKRQNWSLDQHLEESVLSMYFPNIVPELIFEDVDSREWRLGSSDRVAIAYGCKKWGHGAYRDPFAELDNL